MRLIHGWGINDADYSVQPRVDGKRIMCPFYRSWTNMVQRCHDGKFSERRPTYIGCEVCSEWKSFMAFRSWMKTQDWEGKQLDKDLLGDGKLYSPETCCFVEGWLNNLFTDHGRARGEWPVGVYFDRHAQMFRAKLKTHGKHQHLGYYDAPEEASSVYRATKLKHVQELMADYPDQRIKQAVLKKAQELYT